jgi:hypothetical protein
MFRHGCDHLEAKEGGYGRGVVTSFLFRVPIPARGPQIYSMGISRMKAGEGDKGLRFLRMQHSDDHQAKGEYFEVVGDTYALEFVNGSMAI